jgi:hypothetical protein
MAERRTPVLNSDVLKHVFGILDLEDQEIGSIAKRTLYASTQVSQLWQVRETCNTAFRSGVI